MDLGSPGDEARLALLPGKPTPSKEHCKGTHLSERLLSQSPQSGQPPPHCSFTPLCLLLESGFLRQRNTLQHQPQWGRNQAAAIGVNDIL